MTILVETLKALATSFDDRKYPTGVYFFLLDELARASTPTRVSSILAQLIAWKDGKVRYTAAGPFTENRTCRRYSVGKPRPNVLSVEKEQTLSSQAFFAWARNTRETAVFEIGLLNELATFRLWRPDALVMPVFVLHCLQPRVFPIADVWVFLAHKLLTKPEEAALIDSLSEVDRYKVYQEWWLRVVLEAEIDPATAPIEEVKTMDSGIWAFGKRAAALLGAGNPRGRKPPAKSPLAGDQRIMNDAEGSLKHRAVAIWNAGKPGKSQATAIAEAARELGIELKPSYRAYPGSHFWRWRQQGVY